MTHRWDTWLNGPLLPPFYGYLVSASLRVLLTFAALLLLRSLLLYARAAAPGPPALANTLYWLRFWLALRLRAAGVTGVGAGLLALVLIGQVLAGIGGSRAATTPAFLIGSLALWLLLTGMARLMRELVRRLEDR